MTIKRAYSRATGHPMDFIEGIWGDRIPDESCDCYECTEAEYLDDGSIKNNFKWHTLYEPCPDCDSYKTETLDLGRKGYFVCPNAPHR